MNNENVRTIKNEKKQKPKRKNKNEIAGVDRIIANTIILFPTPIHRKSSKPFT